MRPHVVSIDCEVRDMDPIARIHSSVHAEMVCGQILMEHCEGTILEEVRARVVWTMEQQGSLRGGERSGHGKTAGC